MTKTLWQTDIATENHHSWILLTIGKSTHLLWPCSIAVRHDQNLGYSISWPLESGSNGKMPFFKIFLPVLRYEANPFPCIYPMSSHPFNHDFSHPNRPLRVRPFSGAPTRICVARILATLFLARWRRANAFLDGDGHSTGEVSTDFPIKIVMVFP